MRTLTTYTSFWLLCLFCITGANAVVHLRYQSYFSQYGPLLQEAAQNCTSELSDYFNNVGDHPSTSVADCLLSQDGIPETTKSNWAGAAVLLGLIPSILVMFGPKLEQIAVLSTYRPALSILLGLASPAINISSVFEEVDFCKPLERSKRKISGAVATLYGKQSPAIRSTIEVLCYVIALACLANNVQNSVYLDVKTVMGWSPGMVFAPLAWSLLAVIIHGVCMVAIRLRSRSNYTFSIADFFRSERYQTVKSAQDNVFSEFLTWVAAIFAVIQVIFGVLVLSSLIFIGAMEALQVAVQYFVSAAVCQLVVLFQIANMRYDLEHGRSSTRAVRPLREKDSNEAEEMHFIETGKPDAHE